MFYVTEGIAPYDRIMRASSSVLSVFTKCATIHELRRIPAFHAQLKQVAA